MTWQDQPNQPGEWLVRCPGWKAPMPVIFKAEEFPLSPDEEYSGCRFLFIPPDLPSQEQEGVEWKPMVWEASDGEAKIRIERYKSGFGWFVSTPEGHPDGFDLSFDVAKSQAIAAAQQLLKEDKRVLVVEIPEVSE